MQAFLKKIKEFFSPAIYFSDVYWADRTRVNKNYLPGFTKSLGYEVKEKTFEFLLSKIRIEGIFAKVIIEPHKKKQIIVKVTGPEAYVENILVGEFDNMVLITKVKNRSLNFNVVIKGKKNYSTPMPTVIICAPEKTNIGISDIFGETKIGTFSGSLEVNSGMGNVEIEKAHEPILNLLSMGSITINYLSGDVLLNNNGHGNFNILNGNIHRAVVNLTSMGKVSIFGVDGDVFVSTSGHGLTTIGDAKNVTINLSSMGDVNIDNLSGDLEVETNGHGKVFVKQGQAGDLRVLLKGMGGLKFYGQAQNAQLISEGMGDMIVKFVKNQPIIKRKKMGKIAVENWS